MKTFCLLVLLSVSWSQSQKKAADIDVQLSYIDGTLINVHWCGTSQRDDDRVIALTSKGTVYRSEDKGRSWTKASEVFHRKALAIIDDEDQKVGIVNNIVSSPINKQTVLFIGTEAVSWISLDCGQSITALYNGGRQLREFQFHPTDKDLILASAWNKCDQKKNPGCSFYKELMLSENSGLSWHSITQYVNQFAWGYSDKNPLVPQNRILASIDSKAQGHQTITSWNGDADLFYSDDFLTSRKLSVASGARFLISDNYLFVAQVTNQYTKEISLKVADPNTADSYTYSLIDADAELKEHAYTVLDTAEGQVFLVVSHLKAQAPIGVIYISDSTGTRYTKSLKNVARHETGAEFHRVQGLEGIYLANVYSAEQAALYEQSVLESMETGFGSYTQSFKDDDLAKFKQTKITFDKGGIWNTVKAPETDVLGKPIRCDPRSCGLHLHLHSLQYGPVYSRENSIGIIIATGSIGKYLSYRADQVNTYMSRDGGLTWFEIAKGSHIYEISDHGGLIIMADDQKAVNKIHYSWNEGISWNEVIISEDTIEVLNIITEPANDSTRFIVYGLARIEQNNQKVEQGVVVTLDLDDLHQRKCQNIDKAGEQDSDYELWTPSGLVNPECLFGKKVTYIRRKQSAQCFNPEKIERIVSVEPCECTTEDYECDVHFTRDQNTKECVAQNMTAVTEAPIECEGYYTISSGYLKIANDLCEGGLTYQQVRLPCPGSGNGIFEYALVAALLAGVYWIYTNQETVKQFLKPAEKAQASFNQFNPINLEDNDRIHSGRDYDEELLEDKTHTQPEAQQATDNSDQLL